MKRVLGSFTVVLAAVMVLAVPTSSGALPTFSCTVEPFAYEVLDSSFDGHGYSYLARGTTVLTGGACPVAGLAIGIRERGSIPVFNFVPIAVGAYDAQADVNHDGGGDVTVHGRVTLFAPGPFGTFAQTVNVEKGDAELQLEQAAFIDFFSSHDPLIALETIEGRLFSPAGEGVPGIVPLP
jgi:hypothetical protein